MDSSKMVGSFPAVLNFTTGYFSDSTGPFVTNCRFFPIVGSKEVKT